MTITVAQVLESISSQNFQVSHALLTFHNYMRHKCTVFMGQEEKVNPLISNQFSSDETWSPEFLQKFFNEALLYPHWIQNRAVFGQTIKESLLKVQSKLHSSLDLDHVTWPQGMQIIEIENKKDWSDLVNAFLHNQYKLSGNKYRLIFDHDKYLYAVVLHSDQGISIRQFDRKFVIREGFLEPLRTHLTVHYDSQYNLVEDMPHEIEIAPFVSCRFTYQNELLNASLVRGYLFQKFQELRNSPLESYPRLFFVLKKIESLFLKQSSNPFYLDLVQQLERALHLVRIGDPPEANTLTDLQVRTQNALDYVFQSDKILQLLLRDLHSQISMRTTTKSSPSVTPQNFLEVQLNKLELKPTQPEIRSNDHKISVQRSAEALKKWQKNPELDSTNYLPIVE